MPKNSLQSASGLGCSQVCPTCEPQPTGSGSWEDPPFILPHALWLCVQVTAKWYQGPRAIPQPPLLGLCRLSIHYYPFGAPTHGETTMFLLESRAVAQKAVAVYYDFS